MVQPKLQTLTPGVKNYRAGIIGALFGGDFAVAIDSAGDALARVWAVDLVVPPWRRWRDGNTGAAAKAPDFAGMPRGLDRADAARHVRVLRSRSANAAAAGGAAAAILFNEGAAGARGPASQTSDPDPVNQPGLRLRSPPSPPPTRSARSSRVAWTNGADADDRTREGRVVRRRLWRTSNVIAETPTGDPNWVIVVGAHLDSVPAGPGINDNGAGSATILEVAEEFAARRVAVKKNYASCGTAPKSSTCSAQPLREEPRQAESRTKIELMLNFDMIGSPNFVRFVYDGNNSAPRSASGAAQAGRSAGIEQVFLDYFASQGLTTAPTPSTDARTMVPSSRRVGIPAGGLFTGAEGRKDRGEQAAIYGGDAGEQSDPCYHLSCNNLGNLSLTALEQMGEKAAGAHATYVLAQSPKVPRSDAHDAAAARRDDRRAARRAGAARTRRGGPRSARPGGSAVGPEQPLEPHGDAGRAGRATLRTASRTPGMKTARSGGRGGSSASRRSPSITSWWATRPGSRTEWIGTSPAISSAVRLPCRTARRACRRGAAR